MNALLGALRSKTVWFGVAQILWPYITAYINGMPVDWSTAGTTAVTGIGAIILRALTTKPLSAKVAPNVAP